MLKKFIFSNRTKYIVAAVLIIIFSYCLSSFYNEGKFIIPIGNKIIEYSVSGTEEYSVSLKDIKVNSNTYTSTSIDPFILISFKDPQIVKEPTIKKSIEK